MSEPSSRTSTTGCPCIEWSLCRVCFHRPIDAGRRVSVTLMTPTRSEICPRSGDCDRMHAVCDTRTRRGYPCAWQMSTARVQSEGRVQRDRIAAARASDSSDCTMLRATTRRRLCLSLHMLLLGCGCDRLPCSHHGATRMIVSTRLGALHSTAAAAAEESLQR